MEQCWGISDHHWVLGSSYFLVLFSLVFAITHVFFPFFFIKVLLCKYLFCAWLWNKSLYILYFFLICVVQGPSNWLIITIIEYLFYAKGTVMKMSMPHQSVTKRSYLCLIGNKSVTWVASIANSLCEHYKMKVDDDSEGKWHHLYIFLLLIISFDLFKPYWCSLINSKVV